MQQRKYELQYYAFQNPKAVEVWIEINESCFEELGKLSSMELLNQLWLGALILSGVY